MPKLVPDNTLETLKAVARNSPIVPDSPVKTADRITAIIRFTHEHWGEEAFPIEGIGHRMLQFQEEPYKRRIVIGTEWKTLDLGGIDPLKVGLVVIENNEGKNPVSNPTPEERAATALRIVEIGYNRDSTRCDHVHPGMMGFWTPADASKLVARCQSESANCRIYVISK